MAGTIVPLSVTLKNKASQTPADIAQSQRQIERWAGQLVLNTNFSTIQGTQVAGWSTLGWYMDPFGLVHLQGEATYAPGTTANTAISLATLPTSITPPVNRRFVVSLATNTAPSFAYMDVLSSGTLRMIPAATLASPNYSLDGIIYSPSWQ